MLRFSFLNMLPDSPDSCMNMFVLPFASWVGLATEEWPGLGYSAGICSLKLKKASGSSYLFLRSDPLSSRLLRSSINTTGFVSDLAKSLYVIGPGVLGKVGIWLCNGIYAYLFC